MPEEKNLKPQPDKMVVIEWEIADGPGKPSTGSLSLGHCGKFRITCTNYNTPNK